MKRMSGPIPFALLATAGAVVLGYNLWSYCCGRCRLEHFFTLGPAGLVLIVAIAAAAVTLLFLRRRRCRREERGRCRCGTRLSPHWFYCPSCGMQAAPLR